MKPIGTAQDGGTRMSSVVNQQVTAVMPLWRAAEIFGLGRAPASGSQADLAWTSLAERSDEFHDRLR
jgi:hypothetical protein